MKKLLLPLLIAGLLSARPTDVYGLTGSFAPEVISISLVRSGGDPANPSSHERFAYFEVGDPGYEEALGDLWWELATPLDSYDIENME